MSDTLKPPDTASRTDEAEELRLYTRSPHPYLRHGLAHGRHEQHAREKRDAGGSTSPDEHGRSAQALQREWRRPESSTGSESGTEADDERPGLVRALPAPATRPHKGWKFGKEGEGGLTPLLTPSQLDDHGRRLSRDGYFQLANDKVLDERETDKAEKAMQEKLRRRRLAEFVRRSSEVVLLGIITLCVLCGRDVLLLVRTSHREALLAHLAVVATLVTAYPIRLSFLDADTTFSRPWQRFRVPVSYDPATILYPTFLPVLVALSVLPTNQSILLPNIVMALASLPQRLFPQSTRFSGFNVVQWFASLIPMITAENVSQHSGFASSKSFMFTPGYRETIATLYPLHQTLLPALHYVTTTSLLPTELQLLSTSLVNLLLFAQSPQSNILKACLWIGGISLYVSCYKVLSWNVTLARVPKWKLRRPDRSSLARRSFVHVVRDSILFNRLIYGVTNLSTSIDSDADEDGPLQPSPRKLLPNGRPRLLTTGLISPAQWSATDRAPMSAIEPRDTAMSVERETLEPASGRRRRNTLPNSTVPNQVRIESPTSRRKGLRQSQLLWCLKLTPAQAQTREWLYACWVYVAIVAIILGPVRSFVARRALYDQEPIGWALGYLFGDIELFRSAISYLRLQDWIALVRHDSTSVGLSFSMITRVSLARDLIGPANVRLLLFAYWALVLLVGLLTVFSLTAYVEVDTRRKVFHGVMVGMLLPATFVDPCFCALALALVLTVFLLLEVIRAGQVPPLGNAISRFVTPYVDGRDLRGPVVVSHIFLLIGCPVPLWCSLADTLRSDERPWINWELYNNSRDVGMVAGVICVGMGDAAASLFGRRYGKHKWIWIGGKSLEGSAAFSVAVTIGLMAAKVWLTIGGWREYGQGPDVGVLTWITATLKAVFCACGASFMEAVLTGANDNVVVPVALWLLVKGVRL